jgi:hypothetical protein
MSRSFPSLASLVVLTVLPGFGGSDRREALIASDEKTPPNKAGTAGSLAAQEKELADIEDQITAKDKELAQLQARARDLRDKIAKAKGSEELPSLADLLAQLPKNRWPKDEDDSLKWLQANEWFKSNLSGKKATATWLAKRVRFEAAKMGKYNAVVDGTSPKLKLYGKEWSWRLITPHFGGGGSDTRVQLVFAGLTKTAAERLRLVPKGKPLDLTFKIERIDGSLDVRIVDVTIKGIGP